MEINFIQKIDLTKVASWTELTYDKIYILLIDLGIPPENLVLLPFKEIKIKIEESLGNSKKELDIEEEFGIKLVVEKVQKEIQRRNAEQQIELFTLSEKISDFKIEHYNKSGNNIPKQWSRNGMVQENQAYFYVQRKKLIQDISLKLNKPNEIVFFVYCGPRSSGKTSSMYSLPPPMNGINIK
jgi:hypothetical protein